MQGYQGESKGSTYRRSEKGVREFVQFVQSPEALIATEYPENVKTIVVISRRTLPTLGCPLQLLLDKVGRSSIVAVVVKGFA